jgi:hypothetical protein
VAAIGDASAVGARVTFDDGTELGTSLMPGPEGSELRFFVIALEPDADPVRAELLDDSGLVLSTIALE